MFHKLLTKCSQILVIDIKWTSTLKSLERWESRPDGPLFNEHSMSWMQRKSLPWRTSVMIMWNRWMKENGWRWRGQSGLSVPWAVLSLLIFSDMPSYVTHSSQYSYLQYGLSAVYFYTSPHSLWQESCAWIYNSLFFFWGEGEKIHLPINSP